VTTADLLALVEGSETAATRSTGILVQLPVPAQVDSKRVLMAVDPAKDVDGFSPHERRISLDPTGRAWCPARRLG